MSDKEARVVAAGDVLTVKSKDKDGNVIVNEYRVSPICFADLQEIQRAAIKYFKKSYLETFSDNKELLGEQFQELLLTKMEEAARWDINDLPKKRAHDVRAVTLNEKLDERLLSEFGEVPDTDRKKRALLATLLDNGSVTKEEVKALTGTAPISGFVPYDTWWVTAVYEGMVCFVTASLKRSHPDIKQQEIASWPISELYEAARLAEHLTGPDVGNT